MDKEILKESYKELLKNVPPPKNSGSDESERVKKKLNEIYEQKIKEKQDNKKAAK